MLMTSLIRCDFCKDGHLMIACISVAWVYAARLCNTRGYAAMKATEVLYTNVLVHDPATRGSHKQTKACSTIRSIHSGFDVASVWRLLTFQLALRSCLI